MLSVGYLVPDSGMMSREEYAAWEWFSRSRQWDARQIHRRDLTNPASLDGIDVLWWHFDSSTSLPADMRIPEAKNPILDFLRKGGGMLLSLLAAPYTVELGIETVGPSGIRKGLWGEQCWAEDYPDIRGFGSYQGHPVFEGLGQGVYTWNPVPESEYSGAVYDAPALPCGGAVIGVERQYIRLNEGRRVLTEYSVGNGALLAAGTYLFFSSEGVRFRKHLEHFVANCLGHLGKKIRPPGVTVWDFSSRKVEVVERKPTQPWEGQHTLPDLASGLSIIREPGQGKDDPFDVGGRRLLVMGKEKTGLQEIWCHPFRLLRNLRIAVQIADMEPLWLEQLEPRVTVRPECITRTYVVGESCLEETTFVSHDKPAGALHFAVDSNHPLRLMMTCSVDLRMMWPHSEDATGSLLCSWDEGMHAAVVRNRMGNLTTVIGTSLPPDRHAAGQYSSLTLSGGTIVSSPGDAMEASLGFLFEMRGRKLELVLGFAGSVDGEQTALESYRSFMQNPGRDFAGQVDHFKTLFGTSTMITTPEAVVNDGYRWALVGVDRFVVETPKLGTSLMAGFGTTERGWKGGHAVSGRPGYAWYFGRDAAWTALAMLDYGDVESVRSVLEFLGRHQDLSGKILHELTSSGLTHYDAADSTPLYLMLMGRYVRATGDIGFAESQWNRIERAVEFCRSTDTDGDGLIENTNVGHGWVEGGTLFPVHTEVYLAACWGAALEECSFLAGLVKKMDLSARWSTEAAHVRLKIQTGFWNKGTGFYNFGRKADGSYVEEPTVLPAVAAYLGAADPEHGATVAGWYSGSEFSADWGVRILSSESSGYNPRGYHTGSVWPLFTGWAALAEFGSWLPIQGYRHAMANLMLFRCWAAGFVEEVLHGEKLQQAGVCSHQAWSESMVLQPILEGMLGLRMDATKRLVDLRPYVPPHWDELVVSNIRVGTQRLSVSMRRERSRTTFALTTGGELHVRFQPLLPLGTRVTAVRAESDRWTQRVVASKYSDSPILDLHVSGSETVTLEHEGGVSYVPLLPDLVIGQESRGLRFLSEAWKEGEYTIVVEGRKAEAYHLDLCDPDKCVTGVEGGVLRERRGTMLAVETVIPAPAGDGVWRRHQLRFVLRS